MALSIRPLLAEIHAASFGLGYLVLAVVLLFWLGSVVWIAKEKTEDPFDRIVWLMIVLTLNIVGTLIYLLFSDVEKNSARSGRKGPERIREPRWRSNVSDKVEEAESRETGA